MNLPGSTQLAHAKRFLFTLPWQQLAPTTNLFTGATSAAATADGRCALAFSMNGKVMTANLTQFGTPVTARWFDPASGELKTIAGSPFPNTSSREFVPPGMNTAGESDWVLVLEVNR